MSLCSERTLLADLFFFSIAIPYFYWNSSEILTHLFGCLQWSKMIFLSELLNLLLVLELSHHFYLIYWKAVSVIQPKKVFNPVQLKYIQSVLLRIYAFMRF